MTKIVYKPLELDNVIDFVELLAAFGIEETTEELKKASDTDIVKKIMAAAKDEEKIDLETVGIEIMKKLSFMILKKLPGNREAVYKFLAGCTRYADGRETTVDSIRHMNPLNLVGIIKGLAKTENITDFFVAASEYMDLEETPSMSSATEDTPNQEPLYAQP